MFNVIKGGFVNKETKPVVIKPKGKEDLDKNYLDTKNQKQNKNKKQKNLKNDNDLDKETNQELEYTSINENEKQEDEFKGFEIDEELLAKKEELEELSKEIEHMKFKAEQDAKDIVEQAKLKAEIEVNSIKAEAWEVGHGEGFEAGKKQVLLNSSNIFANVQNVMEEALKQKDALLNETKEDIILTIFNVAEKIVKKELTDKEVLKNNLLKAFDLISTSKKVTVYVNWEQLELAEELKEDLNSKFYAIEEFSIVEDKMLLPGGCIIETKMGRIDASIETQLEAIKDGLKD